MTVPIDTIRAQFMALKRQHEKGLEVEVAGTLEIIGSSFVADKPSIFGKPNHDYILREIDWYLSQSLNVNDIPGGPPEIWKQVASTHDGGGWINSNYGYLLFSDENHSQYDHVLRKLVDTPDTRQAIAIYTRPSMHLDWNIEGAHDFVCTNTVQYLLRDNRLHTIVQMRSNDVVFGYRNDWAWQQYVVERLVDDLRQAGIAVEAGHMIWQAASLHVYSRHYDLIPSLKPGRSRD